MSMMTTLFQNDGVEHVQADIKNGDQEEFPVETGDEQQHPGEQAGGEQQRGGRTPRRPEAMGRFLFHRVQLVLFAVQDVIEHIDRPGDQAEENESQEASPDVAGLEHVQGKYHRREDEDVLHPLLGAHGDQEVFFSIAICILYQAN